MEVGEWEGRCTGGERVKTFRLWVEVFGEESGDLTILVHREEVHLRGPEASTSMSKMLECRAHSPGETTSLLSQFA